jgi:hypothetical protein
MYLITNSYQTNYQLMNKKYFDVYSMEHKMLFIVLFFHQNIQLQNLY